MRIKLSHIFNLIRFDEKAYQNLSHGWKVLSLTALASINLVFILFFHISLIASLNEDFLEKLYLLYALFFVFTMIRPFAYLYLTHYSFKDTLIGLTFFAVIIWAYIVINNILALEYKMIFYDEPDTTVLAFGLGGILLTAFSINVYAFVLEKIAKENSKRESEFRLAQKIHQHLIPEIHCQDSSIQIMGKCIIPNDIGGDFIDYSELASNYKVLAIGDVTGHDIGAALLMATCKGAFRSSISLNNDLRSMADSLNQTIYANSNRKMFISFSALFLNMETKNLSHINCGHVPLLHYSQNSEDILEINPKGMALGLVKNNPVDIYSSDFHSGDILCFYTDGITESFNSKNEEFGMDRLKTCILSQKSKTAEEIFNHIMQQVFLFSNNTIQSDDTSLIIVKIK